MYRGTTLVATGLLASAWLGSVAAHHSYAEFDPCASVSIDGEIERINWVNPHVQVTLNSDQSRYHVEWWSLQQLERAGIPPNTLKSGDRIVVTGSAHRDPASKIVTLLTEIRRPSDGWSWSHASRCRSGPV